MIPKTAIDIDRKDLRASCKLFQGLKLRQITFPQHRTEADAPVAWLNPNFDTEPGSGWIDSLTVINVPWKHCVSVFLLGLEQERYRPGKSSTDAVSLPENLALSNVRNVTRPTHG